MLEAQDDTTDSTAPIPPEPELLMKVQRARELLRSADRAEQQLREYVRELVTMRAWTVLGYSDFSTMWIEENGYTCPNHVQVLAIEAAAADGRPTRVEIAQAVGLSVYDQKDTKTGKIYGYQSPVVSAVLTQLEHGVPAEHVVKSGSKDFSRVIAQYGDRPYEPMGRSRAQPRRMGKGIDELVSESFNLSRRDADEIADIAREAAVPKAEIYRQAVAEYLDRLRTSRRVAS